jgi:hypothetical protein
MLLFLVVGGVGRHDAHADAQTEVALPECQREDVGCGLGEVHCQLHRQPGACARQERSPDGQDDQSHDGHRHGDLHEVAQVLHPLQSRDVAEKHGNPGVQDVVPVDAVVTLHGFDNGPVELVTSGLLLP